MIVAAGVVLRAPTGRILLLKRSEAGDMAGLWALPGGKKDEGDGDLRTTVVRECLEEIGYNIGTTDRELGRREANGVDYTTFFKEVDDEFTPKLNEEHSEYKWVMPSEALHGTD